MTHSNTRRLLFFPLSLTFAPPPPFPGGAHSLRRLYDFDCVTGASKPHWQQFRCSSRFVEDAPKQKIMVTDFRSHTLRQETRDVREGLHLFALAMLYTAAPTAVC